MKNYKPGTKKVPQSAYFSKKKPKMPKNTTYRNKTR